MLTLNGHSHNFLIGLNNFVPDLKKHVKGNCRLLLLKRHVVQFLTLAAEKTLNRRLGTLLRTVDCLDGVGHNRTERRRRA